MRATRQYHRGALRDMSPLWIVLTLLPFFGEAARFNCKGRILGAYYADAKSGCKAFHVCVRVAGGGVRDFRFFCPPGTLFHQEAQTCTDWGDDDPLACPVDLYDGQFDLYRIGSGFDTKKASSPGNRDEEPEFGLQQAETSDRRLSENSISSNGATSDLKTAHSSDFFSGQRDRGRDDLTPQVSQSTAQRQSFRRVPTRATQRTTQYTQNTTPPPPTTTKYSNPSNYETASKRKLVRKRPIYATTATPSSTNSQNTIPQKSPNLLEQNFDRQVQNRQSSTAPVSIPQGFKEYKEEYVEVTRVTPKSNKVAKNTAYSASYSPSTPFPKFDKNGLVELYNYEAQSSPQVNDNQSFKVRHSFKVAPEFPKEPDYSRTKIKPSNGSQRERITSTTQLDNNSGARNFDLSTQTYKDINSVSYEPEKNNFVSFSAPKQNYYNNPTTTPSTTTIFTTTRTEPQKSFNNIAYNTNNGINAKSYNYPETGEDDGQYRPPAEEDDGQYRPELYERELLSGAHSLNIAASGNRLPEDQKPRGKTQPPPKVAQTAAPRPFRPSPTPTSSKQTPQILETITTTFSPRVTESQRTFDYFQTYTTTSRPSDTPVPFYPIQNFDVDTKSLERPTTLAPKVVETRPTTRAPITSSVSPKKPTSRPPHFAHPANNKEDNSYDYAYYDTDPGFSEYDNIEEFGRTKTKG